MTRMGCKQPGVPGSEIFGAFSRSNVHANPSPCETSDDKVVRLHFQKRTVCAIGSRKAACGASNASYRNAWFLPLTRQPVLSVLELESKHRRKGFCRRTALLEVN